MSYLVTVRRDGQQIASYPGIGNSFDLWHAASDQFGPCSISVMRQQ